MKAITINGKEYKVKYTYRSLAKTDILDRAITLASGTRETVINEIIVFTAELLLCGLQKFHSDEFGYTTDKEKEEMLDKVYDLMDDYDEDPERKEGENAGDLMEILFSELTTNGFLSMMSQQTQASTKKKK